MPASNKPETSRLSLARNRHERRRYTITLPSGKRIESRIARIMDSDSYGRPRTLRLLPDRGAAIDSLEELTKDLADGSRSPEEFTRQAVARAKTQFLRIWMSDINEGQKFKHDARTDMATLKKHVVGFAVNRKQRRAYVVKGPDGTTLKAQLLLVLDADEYGRARDLRAVYDEQRLVDVLTEAGMGEPNAKKSGQLVVVWFEQEVFRAK